MTHLPTALLFDLDDTIIDDSSTMLSGWSAAVGECAPVREDLEAPISTIHEVRDWYWSDAERHRVGRADLRSATVWIVGEALTKLGTPDAELAHAIGHRYRDLREESQELIPGAVETLDALCAEGVRLALLTNGGAEGQRAKIDRFGLAGFFEYICVEGEFGCGKPDERVYRAALAELDATPEATWMVGDNIEWDVAAPMRLGITGIWLDRHGIGLEAAAAKRHFKDPLPPPDRIISSLRELLPAASGGS